MTRQAVDPGLQATLPGLEDLFGGPTSPGTALVPAPPVTTVGPAADLQADLIAHGLAARQAQTLAAHILAPVILHRGGWRGSCQLDRDIGPSRIAAALAGTLIEAATDPEVVAYLMSASLTMPLGSDWTHIYCVLAVQYMVQCPSEDERALGMAQHATIDDALRRELGADRGLSDYQELLLRQLRGDIAQARGKHARRNT